VNKHVRLLTMLALWLLAAVAHAGTVTYVYTDPQGTPLAEADANGNITARFEYTPYGVSVPSMGAAPNGVGYTGHVNDPETGLVYMQARYYDAEVGRFLSVDPVGSKPGDGFNFNRYLYTDGNPITKIDPDGKAPMTEREATKLATDLNRTSSGGSSGHWAVVQVGKGPNDFTIQSSDQVAMERGGLTQQAEQGYQPGRACPQMCAAIAVAAALTAGDISDDPNANTTNGARDATDVAEKARKLAESAPASGARDMAKGLRRVAPTFKALLAVPATHNNYKQCIEECPKAYEDRSSTTKSREQ
jgi:RHS repeat-associated protein